jgi:hypothetical protein
MAQDLFGVSFMPGAEGEDGNQDAQQFQEAVKLLNLRLPSVLGARSPVSPQLLGATGLQGQPDMQFLRQLLGLDIPQPGAPRRTEDPFRTQTPTVPRKTDPRFVVEEPIPAGSGQAPQPPGNDGSPRPGGIEFQFPGRTSSPGNYFPPERDDRQERF